MKTSIEAHAARINGMSLPKIMIEIGAIAIEVSPGQKARCMFHKPDRHPSFEVGEHHFRCWGCGMHGDNTAFLKEYTKVSPEGVDNFLARLAAESGGTVNPPVPAQVAQAPAQPVSVDEQEQDAAWAACLRAANSKFLAWLSNWRGISLEMLLCLVKMCLLGSFEGKPAFAIRKNGRVVGAHWRREDGEWLVTWFTHEKGIGLQPLIIGDLHTCSEAHLFEGQWDASAVLSHLRWYDSESRQRIAAVVTRGAQHGRKIAGLIPSGKTVYAWPQNDTVKTQRGTTPAEEWLAAVIKSAGTSVRVVKTPAPHKDANDWLRTCTGDAELLAAIQSAQLSVTPSAQQLTVRDREPKPFDAYYDKSRKSYWMANSRDEWFEISETSIKRHLRAADYSPRIADGDVVSPLDAKLIAIQTTNDIAYAGRLAGHSKGLTECCKSRILVTESPSLIAPQKGEWPMLGKLIEGMLAESQNDQRPWLFGWLKIGIQALHAGQTRPGQILVLAGPRDCGKSLLQNLITELLGRRVAKPYRYMTGSSPFNGDLFEAEHLAIEDEVSATGICSRRNFGARVKEFTVNEVQSCHAKYRQALSLRPFWRVSITVNDEPENLLILPPLDESLMDKFILLKASLKPMPMPTQTLEERKAFWNTLLSELPAFVHFLLHEYELPEGLKSARFGVTHYHHPELLAAIAELAPEVRLLGLIDMWFSQNHDAEDLCGTALEIERELRRSHGEAEINKLFTFNTACGVYLSRLQHKLPSRILYHRDAEQRLWLILKPGRTKPNRIWPPLDNCSKPGDEA